MKPQIYRHGEIGFVKIPNVPKGLKETKTNEIVRGSHGNPHTFKGGSNCLQKPYNIHRNRLKTLAFYY